MTKKQRFKHESTIRDHIHAVRIELKNMMQDENLTNEQSSKLHNLIKLLGYTQDEVQELLKADYE